jgi:hypothetical protein
LTEKLSTFRTPIAHERLNILVKAVHCVLHFAVPLLGALETGFKVKKFLINPPVF